VEKDAEAAKLLDKALSDLRAGAENLPSDARLRRVVRLKKLLLGT
jgi:hypothetical protein